MNFTYRDAVVSDYLRCRKAEPDLSISAYYGRLLKADPVVPFTCKTLYNWISRHRAKQHTGAVTWVNSDVALVEPAEQHEQLERLIPSAPKTAPAPAGIAASGLLAGLAPAYRAMAIKPIEAIRDE